MKFQYGEISDIADLNWFLIEERLQFTTMKLCFSGLNKKKMPGNLRLKTEKEKLTSRENSITLMHKNKNVKSVHLEDANKIVDNLNEIWEEIS